MKIDANYSVFIYHNKLMFISIYLDNLFIINENLNIINSFKNNLLEYFYITELGSISYYLDMSIA